MTNVYSSGKLMSDIISGAHNEWGHPVKARQSGQCVQEIIQVNLQIVNRMVRTRQELTWIRNSVNEVNFDISF